ncbi:MAG TPA: cation-translocating P-type ATPase, partial [Polyangiaceae bacterium]|nr:cation-translocating P-type ATPase [Polyangiaceae bacterium]
LREHALDGYYSYRDREPGNAPPALATGRDYSEFDDPRFLDLYAGSRGDHRTLELLLEGVHCAACVWLVEKLPELVPGVTSCRLDYARRTALVSFRAGAPGPGAGAASGATTTQASAIARTLDRLGYPPHPHREGARAAIARREERDLLTRLGVAGASAGNSMLFALALYSGGFADMDAEQTRYFRLLSALVALPAVTWSAAIFYRGALGALRARRPHMDLPLSLGIVLGVLWGTFNLLRGAGEVYFDSLSTLVFVLLAARLVQVRQQARAELAAGSAHALTPHAARQLDAAGAVTVVPAESIPHGARVEVLAGDTFPVDGEVIVGASQADTSWLSGESEPQRIEVGSEVFAGTTNLMSRVVVSAERSGAETRAARLWREVERAAQRRAPIATVAERASAYFLIGVLLLAVIAFLAWLPAGAGRAIEVAVALLVVTCPCGLALATPLTVSAALGQAARAGLLIKGGAFIEALSKPALIVFDKTGTLTEGRLSLVRWVGDTSLGPQIKALEQASSHPLARALVRALSHVPAGTATQVEQHLGIGVRGIVDGRRVTVGAVASATAPLPEWADTALRGIERDGQSPVVVCVDGVLRAVLAVGDPIRPDAARVLARLRQSGNRLVLLSGDRTAVVEHVVRQLARQSGVRELFETAGGELGPEAKLAFVEAARARGERVFMVGDGVNDAAALAAASVGVAVHGGAEASLQAAGVFATRPGVEPLLELLRGSRRALGVIHMNLALSLAYNVAAASLCLAGAITPLWAAVIMPLSSLTVVSHSYRRRMFGVEK